jgi:hypothetical protein
VLSAFEREANGVGMYGVGRILHAQGAEGVVGALRFAGVVIACRVGGDGVCGLVVGW